MNARPQTTFAHGINIFTGLTATDVPPIKLKKKPGKPGMTAREAADIRQMHADGIKRKIIAAKYNVSVYTIDDVVGFKGAYK